MPHRQLLLDVLKMYKTTYEEEEKFRLDLLKFIEENENCFDRSNLSGHVTGSAWLLNPDEKKVLLTHHKKLNRWLQLGGHSDGDNNTRNVALREATEESGISDILFVSQDVFDIDIHIIPENTTKNEPEHKHYDVRFLLKAPHESFIISDESNALKWVTKHDLLKMKQNKEISFSMMRMIDKWLERSL